jgi:hypothetical protein
MPPQYYAQLPAKKTPLVFDKTDSLFSAMALVIGFLFCELILFGGLGIGVPLFFITAYAGILFYGLKSKSMDVKKGASLSVPIMLLLLCFVLYDNQVLNVLNLGFLFFLATLQFMTMFGVRDHVKLSKGVLFDFVGGFVGRPLMNMDKLFVVVAKGSKDEKGKRLFVRILIGVIICIPLLAVILSLLASADFAFESVLKKIADSIGDKVWEYFGKFMLGFVIAIPLFGAFFAFRYNRKNGAVTIPNIVGNLDQTIVYTVMTVVVAVYLFFLFVQFNYMFFAFSGKLPGGFNYAEYARRGFFELVAIALINLGLLAIFYLFTARKQGKLTKVLKTYLLTLSVVTLIIIVSAVSKMVMYMQIYGLTQLRVYTSWFMVLTAVIFVAAIIKIMSRKFDAVKIICVFFTVWFLMLNYVGVDALIAKYNIAKSNQDNSVLLDVNMFENLSDSMVAETLQLLDSESVIVRQDTKRILTARYDMLQEKNWQSMNVASVKAGTLLESNKDKYYLDYYESPYGSPGTDIEMISHYLPNIKNPESCEWYYQTYSPDFFSTSSNGTVVYGQVVLSEAYFNEIIDDYEWIGYIEFMSDWHMAMNYVSEMSKNGATVKSQKYTDEQAEGRSLSMVLNKAKRTLYFYLET